MQWLVLITLGLILMLAVGIAVLLMRPLIDSTKLTRRAYDGSARWDEQPRNEEFPHEQEQDQ